MIENAIAGSAAMWGKRDDMIVRGQLPFNAEPPPSVLASSEITPVDAFYARNHGPFPDIAAAAVATDRGRLGGHAAER